MLIRPAWDRFFIRVVHPLFPLDAYFYIEKRIEIISFTSLRNPTPVSGSSSTERAHQVSLS